jgi:hypothetical protein
MLDLDLTGSLDIRYGTTDTEDTIIDTSRELQLLCRRYGDLERCVLYGCEFLDVDVRHLSVGVDALPDESLSLHLASLHDEELEFATRLPTALLTEFSGLHSRHLDEYIDTIEYRSGESRAILVDRQW